MKFLSCQPCPEISEEGSAAGHFDLPGVRHAAHLQGTGVTAAAGLYHRGRSYKDMEAGPKGTSGGSSDRKRKCWVVRTGCLWANFSDFTECPGHWTKRMDYLSFLSGLRGLVNATCTVDTWIQRNVDSPSVSPLARQPCGGHSWCPVQHPVILLEGLGIHIYKAM